MKYEERIVLFLDILGFKNHIFGSVQNQDIFKNIYLAMEEIKQYGKNDEKIPHREVTTFSDSIVISYPIEVKFFGRILNEIRELILILLKYDFVCRGGVGFGELYHKDSVVFGPAMVKAYELESKHAIYPRVIICSEDIKKYNLKSERDNIKQDEKDGYTYFNIFNFNYLRESGQMLDVSKFIKDKLEYIISANINNKDQKISMKYEWLSQKLTEGLKVKRYFISGLS